MSTVKVKKKMYQKFNISMNNSKHNQIDYFIHAPALNIFCCGVCCPEKLKLLVADLKAGVWAGVAPNVGVGAGVEPNVGVCAGFDPNVGVTI